MLSNKAIVVRKPAVDKSLLKMDGLPRSIECLRYFVLSTEHWISPNGQVRHWLQKNLLLAVLLAIPTFLVLPVLTVALWQITVCSEMLTGNPVVLIFVVILGLVIRARMPRR